MCVCVPDQNGETLLKTNVKGLAKASLDGPLDAPLAEEPSTKPDYCRVVWLLFPVRTVYNMFPRDWEVVSHSILRPQLPPYVSPAV